LRGGFGATRPYLLRNLRSVPRCAAQKQGEGGGEDTREAPLFLGVCVFGVRCCVCRARAYEYLLVQPLLTLAGTVLAQSLTRQPGAGGARDGVSRGARGGDRAAGSPGPGRRRRRAGRPPARPPRCRGPAPRARAAALAFTIHIETIKNTTQNSSKFGAGAQTAAPGPRSTLDPPAPRTRPRHRHRRVGVYAPRHERQHRRADGRSASPASSAAAAAASSPAATAAAT